jgi:transcriptional regulator with XRE-family HTH domain
LSVFTTPPSTEKVGINDTTARTKRVPIVIMLRIKELRIAKRLTQAQLASMAGLSRSYLAELEKGDRPVNTFRVARLAKELGVEPRDLYPPLEDDGFILKLRQLPAQDRAQVESLLSLLYEKIPKDGKDSGQ